MLETAHVRSRNQPTSCDGRLFFWRQASEGGGQCSESKHSATRRQWEKSLNVRKARQRSRRPAPRSLFALDPATIISGAQRPPSERRAVTMNPQVFFLAPSLLVRSSFSPAFEPRRACVRARVRCPRKGTRQGRVGTSRRLDRVR